MYNIRNRPTKIDQKTFHCFRPPFFGVKLHFNRILHFVVLNMFSVHSVREPKLKLIQLNSPSDIQITSVNNENNVSRRQLEHIVDQDGIN